MRAHIRGTGLALGLVITVFGSPVAWADNAANGVTNEATNINETVSINETTLFPVASGDPDAQVVQVPRGAPETGGGGQDADGGSHLSMSMLALGMALGATAAAGAIVWREVRR